MQHAKPSSPPTQFTVVPCMSWCGFKLAGADTVHTFIYIRRVGFVKCHEWRVACNPPTLACLRIIAAAIAFEVRLQVASVASSVFMTSQLYRRLSALSVLSRYCWVNACRLPPVIRYDTILMLVRSTSPLGDRASLPPVSLSVTDLPPPSSRCFTVELNGPYVLRHIHTMRRRFGDRSAGGSVLSPSQLDGARTRDWVGSGIKFGSREPEYPLTSLEVIWVEEYCNRVNYSSRVDYCSQV